MMVANNLVACRHKEKVSVSSQVSLAYAGTMESDLVFKLSNDSRESIAFFGRSTGAVTAVASVSMVCIGGTSRPVVSGFSLLDGAPHEFLEVSPGEQLRLHVPIPNNIRAENKGGRCQATLRLRAAESVDSDKFQM
jgi:hypothetical protein